jgi:acid stress-induced BolA-like protein IbaG/YrbA
MDASMLENLIKIEIPDAVVQVRDVRGDGLYFSATVVSGQFAGMTRIQQHRRVHQAIEEFIGNDDVHALQLTTRVMK